MKQFEEYFLIWPDSFGAGAERVGGKGWNLGKLYRYGFKIPIVGLQTKVCRIYQRIAVLLAKLLVGSVRILQTRNNITDNRVNIN